MAKRILVPLDGAPSSEAVVSLVADIARSAGSTVRLLHVDRVPDTVERTNGRVIAYADQEMARLGRREAGVPGRARSEPAGGSR